MITTGSIVNLGTLRGRFPTAKYAAASTYNKWWRGGSGSGEAPWAPSHQAIHASTSVSSHNWQTCWV
ncbi:hypothetical protein Pcinc_021128 [Petrolisthes cinctipes]|uniref:Uncharacterized protein n=1 Tax=Petrolisthes cinctipes TaxID=88211 RepID=A0AAE1FIT3_PETCI|nr:hypothetical protein Pcinc_021128 [Petrolisthes cinctipes]